MKMPTRPITLHTEYGALFVSVVAAIEQRHYDVDERRDVVTIQPQVYVSSTPEFAADPQTEDHWVIRKRRYAVLHKFRFHDLSHLANADGVPGNRWHMEDTPDRGGYRNDRHAPVQVLSATWDLMDAAVTDALDAFDSAHPAWRDLSLYLWHKERQASAELKAARLRTELAKAEEKAQRYDEQGTAVAANTPAYLTALITD